MKSQMNRICNPNKKKVVFFTFLGGGGGFCANASFTASAADSASLFNPFLESVSDKTTKKWWHFSHLTNLVEATTEEHRYSGSQKSQLFKMQEK